MPSITAIWLPWGFCARRGTTCCSVAGNWSMLPVRLTARSVRSVLSSAVTAAPMRLPWFSSTDWMVSSSPELTAERNP